MNLIDVWFSLIERQAIHRGTFRSVRDLNAKIRALAHFKRGALASLGPHGRTWNA